MNIPKTLRRKGFHQFPINEGNIGSGFKKQAIRLPKMPRGLKLPKLPKLPGF